MSFNRCSAELRKRWQKSPRCVTSVRIGRFDERGSPSSRGTQLQLPPHGGGVAAEGLPRRVGDHPRFESAERLGGEAGLLRNLCERQTGGFAGFLQLGDASPQLEVEW